MNREQIVRDTAYAIWEAEGKPDGRADDHWQQAESRVVDSPKTAGPAATIASPATKIATKSAAKSSATKVAAPKAKKPSGKKA